MGAENTSFEQENPTADDILEDAVDILQELNQDGINASETDDTNVVRRESASDNEDALVDINGLDDATTATNADFSNLTGVRQRNRATSDDHTEEPTVPASDEESTRSHSAWSILSKIKATMIQFGGRRSPGIYDDTKSTDPTTNFNNNELYKDVNIVYSDGLTPLTRAIRGGNVAEVAAILEHPDITVDLPEVIPHKLGSSLREPDRTPLVVAVQTGQTEMVRLLLEAGADVNATDGDQYSALYYAANEDYSDILKLLLRYGPKLESPNSYQDPLYTACRHGHTEVVNMLLTAGCAINRSSDRDQASVLIVAMESLSEELCLQLIRMGANMITGNKTTEPFIAACQYGYPLVVQACIRAGCDPNMKLSNGICPILAAIKLCNYQNDRALLYGTSLTDPHKLSPRVKELFLKRMSIVQLLCDYGCSLNEGINVGSDFSSVLANAIQFDNLPCAYILLKHGARWDQRCHRNLVKAQDSLTNNKFKNSNIELMQSIFIPKIVQILSHTERTEFQRETTYPFSLPSMKDCCRHVIRRSVKQQTMTSVIPLISALDLPQMLLDYLSYVDCDELDACFK